MMDMDSIKADSVYRTAGGSYYRVLKREGQKLIIQRIDETKTYECSVGRFSARVISTTQQTSGA